MQCSPLLNKTTIMPKNENEISTNNSIIKITNLINHKDKIQYQKEVKYPHMKAVASRSKYNHHNVQGSIQITH